MALLRLAVFLIYLAYLVVIVIALSSNLLPLRWTVLACLAIHFLGLLVGSLIELPPGYDVYPKVLGRFRPLIIFWDVVQAVVLILLIAAVRFYVAAAVIAIIGIVGCFYKFYKVMQLIECQGRSKPCTTCTPAGCEPGCCGCKGDCRCKREAPVVPGSYVSFGGAAPSGGSASGVVHLRL